MFAPVATHTVILICLSAILLGWTSSIVSNFHRSYSEELHRHEQYKLLAKSITCTSHTIRMATIDVNNCAMADRYISGEILSPFVAASLEVLADFAICGRNGSRCQHILDVISQSSLCTSFLTTLLAASALSMLWQKRCIEHAYTHELPLSSAKYPSSVPFYLASKSECT
jgi:hypothetical protein